MKTSVSVMYVFAFLFCTTSCSKNTGQSFCTAQYIAPTIKFNIVDKTLRNDLFFSPSPNYSVNDIKIRFRNEVNKPDSIIPAVESSGNDKHFTYSVPTLRTSDTCYIQIKGLLSNTIYYVISKDNSPCKTPFVSMVTVDKGTAINYNTNDLITIKK